MAREPFRIVFAIYPGMTQLDFTGPHQFLSRMPGAEVVVASPAGGDVASEGLVFAGTVPLADVQHCDLICIPGGLSAVHIAQDEDFLSEVRRLALAARYVTSVCTGSLILGAAGLLKGRRAACHWAWRELLPLFGAVPDEGRVVQDGNILTGGGVTAGIDFALAVLAEVAGEPVARTIQLGLEYAPEPPFDCGRPERAAPAVVAACRRRMGGSATERWAEAQRVAEQRRAVGSGA